MLYEGKGETAKEDRELGQWIEDKTKIRAAVVDRVLISKDYVTLTLQIISSEEIEKLVCMFPDLDVEQHISVSGFDPIPVKLVIS